MSTDGHPIPSRLWVIHLTEKLTRQAHLFIARWSSMDRAHLGDQWTRAIDSIGLNVSEGYARAHFGERKHFYSYASGSVEEVLYCVRRARDRGLITRLEAWRYSELLHRLAIGIQNLTCNDVHRS
jgi:four helix bundle protein